MPDVKATPVSLKCKVCGGDIRNDYLAGTCACMNCGNRWSLADIIPDYAKYSKIIANINNANSIVETGTKATSANEAKLLFKTAIMECNRFNDHVSADLINVCEEGVKQTELLGCYIKGKTYYEKRSYSSAVRELAKVPGYRDADVIVEILFLREQFGCPWAVCIILFLLGSAGLGYVLYRGGVISVIIKIISFLAATPLIIYSILAYGFHMKSSLAVVIAIVGPIVMFILFASFTEQITKKNK